MQATVGVAPVSGARRITFTVLAAIAGIACETGLFGFMVVVGFFLTGADQIHRVHYISFGIAFGLVAGIGVFAQLRRPDRRIAGLQAAALITLGVTIGIIAGGRFGDLAFMAIVAVPLAILAMLHPARSEFFRRGDGISRPLAVVAAGGAVPLLWFAASMVHLQRTFPANDPHVSQGHYAYMAGIAIGLVLVAFLAALKTRGWRLAAWLAGLGVAVYGLASALEDGYASSEGVAWGLAAILGGLAFVGVAEWEATRTQT